MFVIFVQHRMLNSVTIFPTIVNLMFDIFALFFLYFFVFPTKKVFQKIYMMIDLRDCRNNYPPRAEL